MINAGFSTVSSFSGSGSSKRPTCKGYVGKIVNVDATPSKAGKPMLRFDIDIADGEFAGYWAEYPKRLYQTYGDDNGLGRLKGIIETIVAENPAFFPEEDIFAAPIDETRFIGREIGFVTKWDKDQGKYLEVSYICSKERALAAKEVPQPEQKEASGFDVGGQSLAEQGVPTTDAGVPLF